MSNVASLELCKELYELSGWWDDDTEQWGRLDNTEFPLYDLGYLLRKLPNEPNLWRAKKSRQWYAEVGTREFDEDGHEAAIVENADTPEDAACKLAIELWKQGILNGATK